LIVNGGVIIELARVDVHIATTRAQQAKARIPLTIDKLKDEEPRKSKTKQD
jgi:hypothetical protein